MFEEGLMIRPMALLWSGYILMVFLVGRQAMSRHSPREPLSVDQVCVR